MLYVNVIIRHWSFICFQLEREKKTSYEISHKIPSLLTSKLKLTYFFIWSSLFRRARTARIALLFRVLLRVCLLLRPTQLDSLFGLLLHGWLLNICLWFGAPFHTQNAIFGTFICSALNRWRLQSFVLFVYLLDDALEGHRHIGRIKCTGLNQGHLFFFSVLCRVLRRNFPHFGQISLVADQHENHVFFSVRAQLIQPLFSIFKAFRLGYIVD